jgi:hypothetical protein
MVSSYKITYFSDDLRNYLLLGHVVNGQRRFRRRKEHTSKIRLKPHMGGRQKLTRSYSRYVVPLKRILLLTARLHDSIISSKAFSLKNA